MSLPKPYYSTQDVDLYQGDCRNVIAGLPERHFHCCVTSPPYFGLRSYLPAGHPDKALEIGSEATPEEFVNAMLSVFGGKDNPVGVWRVLRDDGVCFVNIGDSYASSGGDGRQGTTGQREDRRFTLVRNGGTIPPPGLKPKDLCGTPWRLALALQAAGWYWRDTICWHKPSPMPGSQRDRCTSSWEPVLMLTKAARYFWDMEAAKEESSESSVKRLAQDVENQQGSDRANAGGKTNGPMKAVGSASLRIPRNVWRLDWDEDDIVALLNYMNAGPSDANIWKIASEGFGKAHFATFPKALPAKCITAATSEKGCCPECGAPWVRVVDRERVPTRPGANSKVNDAKAIVHPYHHAKHVGNRDPQRHTTATATRGWRPGCECGGEPVPCRCVDPFGGAGTTALASIGLQRHCSVIELSETYCEMAVARLRAGLYATSTKRDDLQGQQVIQFED